MPRRRPAGTLTQAIITFLLLTPPLVQATQQQLPDLVNAAVEATRVKISTAEPASTRTTHNDSTETPQIETSKQRKEPVVIPTDASAVATLALDGFGRSVDAPSVKTTQPAGLVSPLEARSLHNWEVENFVLMATIDGKIYARDRRTGDAKWALEVPDSPMIRTIDHRFNQSGTEGVRADSPFMENDYLWAVEPNKDGNIYIITKTGPRKLGPTVRDLVDKTPWSDDESPFVYNADKKTTMYEVNARTGQFLKQFGSQRAAVEKDQSCRRVVGLELDEIETCGPHETLVLGRVQYTVTIQDRATAENLYTIEYSEWVPNLRDEDLQAQYTQTRDGNHLHSLWNGQVLGVDYAAPENKHFQMRTELPSPVGRVFNVIRSVNPDSQDTSLTLLSQPVEPPGLNSVRGALGDSEKDVFVNCTETGDWYVLSESMYPFVTSGAKRASAVQPDFVDDRGHHSKFTLEQHKTALVGVHTVETGSTQGLTISAPVSNSAMNAPIERALERVGTDVSESSLPDILSGRKSWFSVSLYLILFLCAFGVVAKQRLSAHSGTGTDTLSMRLQKDPMDVVVDRAVNKVAKPEATEPVATPEQPGDVENAIAPIVSNAQVQFQEPERAPEDKEENSSPPLEKKKAHRGKRGGKGRNKRAASTGPKEGITVEDAPIPEAPPIAQPVTTINGFSNTVSNHVTNEDGTIQIGKLAVDYTKKLGEGSHGTQVFRGSFDGRAVAIKRMLHNFYDLAEREVGLLQESDEHRNVIRYFCREMSGEFLFIALELCPASLAQVVERENYRTAVDPTGAGLDVPNVLKQVTEGVRHLHSLKIVHRDLKPQNILVAPAPKPRGANGLANGGIRVMISDFGLCKRLEDDQSSFRATTAHAAGTSGWRAPELLVDDAPQPSAPLSNHSNGDTSDVAVVDPQTNRRATKAIDIFSLGCIFYYVITQGQHPFDKGGKFMREANIVEGKHNLESLRSLGQYSYEADDLIRQMIAKDPRVRPSASTILIHPFFWSAEDRLNFLCSVSDYYEHESQVYLQSFPTTSTNVPPPPSPELQYLESLAPNVIGPGRDFLSALPKRFINSLGKQRKYTGSRMVDLLRALRNKKCHYHDMEEGLKAEIGGLPDGYLAFWTQRFPALVVNCHMLIVERGLTGRSDFARYFELRGS